MDTNHELWCKKGHFNKDQSDFYIELVKQKSFKYILETGFCTGRSAFSILKEGKDIQKFISIDINLDYIKPEGRIMKDKISNSYKNFSLIENSSRKILNDNFFRKEFPNGIDWFTVDGDHSYQGCLFDLEAAYKYINKSGIIIIDDYKSGPPNGCKLIDVEKACNEFYSKHPELHKWEWHNKGKGFCIFEKSFNYIESKFSIGQKPHPSELMGTNKEPWLVRKSIEYIYSKRDVIKNILEFGSGASTAWFLDLFDANVVSIEDNQEWLNKIIDKIPKELKEKWKCHLKPAKTIGSIRNWIGINKHDNLFYDDYVNIIDELDITFDLILIDGKARNDCIKRSLKKLSKNGYFVIDNAERKQYEEAINMIPKDWLRLTFENKYDTTIIYQKN